MYTVNWDEMWDSEDRAKRSSKHTRNVAQVDPTGRQNNGRYMVLPVAEVPQVEVQMPPL